MWKHQCKTPKDMKKQGNTMLSKNQSNLLVTKTKDLETYDLPNKEFKMAE